MCTRVQTNLGKLNMQRREFLSTAVLGGLAVTLPVPVFAADTAGLPNLAAKAVPIGKDERMARIAKAKELMRANDIGALLIEPGSSLIYFTGVEWWRSERLTAAGRSEEHTSELQSIMRISYAVFCLTKKNHTVKHKNELHMHH